MEKQMMTAVSRCVFAKRSVVVGAMAAMLALGAIAATAGEKKSGAVVGEAAPAFTLKDENGKPVSLSDFSGKVVVLEWFNNECPFVQKHYTGGDMNKLAEAYKAKGVVWLAVNSTNPSHYDYLKPAALDGWMKTQGGTPRTTLMDEAGNAGRAYSARTTPQMFVINPEGRVVYAGAIDDKRSANPEDVKGARNHVRAALDESLAGKPVSVAATTPYGCSVKY
jgi:peroxiredoxin